MLRFLQNPHPWVVDTSGTLEGHCAFGALECSVWTGARNLVNTDKPCGLEARCLIFVSSSHLSTTAGQMST